MATCCHFCDTVFKLPLDTLKLLIALLLTFVIQKYIPIHLSGICHFEVKLEVKLALINFQQ